MIGLHLPLVTADDLAALIESKGSQKITPHSLIAAARLVEEGKHFVYLDRNNKLYVEALKRISEHAY